MMNFFLPSAVPAFTSAANIGATSFVLLFPPREIYLKQDGDNYAFPRFSELAGQGVLPDELLFAGTLDGVNVYAAMCPALNSENGFASMPMRVSVGYFSFAEMEAIGRARELVLWRASHIYCGHCGKAKLQESGHDSGLVCPQCGAVYFPQIAPAVIVAVLRGDEILLAHNRNFQPGIYGLIAGFIEAGESAESAIHREIREETGIEVKNIRYFSSQTWPFPNSLMLGYYAEYAGGTAKADGTELEDLGWFDAEHLPSIPLKGSIARRIIDDFMEKHRK